WRRRPTRRGPGTRPRDSSTHLLTHCHVSRASQKACHARVSAGGVDFLRRDGAQLRERGRAVGRAAHETRSRLLVRWASYGGSSWLGNVVAALPARTQTWTSPRRVARRGRLGDRRRLRARGYWSAALPSGLPRDSALVLTCVTAITDCADTIR